MPSGFSSRSCWAFLRASGLVDVLGALCGVGEDHHPVGEHLEEAAGDEDVLVVAVVAHRHLAGAQRGEQGDVTGQDPELALDARGDDEVRLPADQPPLGGDQLHLQLGHQLFFSFPAPPVSFFAFSPESSSPDILLAFSTASSMEPHM